MSGETPNNIEGEEGKIVIRIPAVDILSEAKDHSGYEDVFVEGVDIDSKGNQKFVLSKRQEDGTFVTLDPSLRIGPERDDELKHFEEILFSKEEGEE